MKIMIVPIKVLPRIVTVVNDVHPRKASAPNDNGNDYNNYNVYNDIDDIDDDDDDTNSSNTSRNNNRR